MKKAFKFLGVILGGLVLLVVVVLPITGFEPHGRTPGLWLKGDVVTAPVTDWSFVDAIETIKLQTSTQYLLPHSVTTYCVSANGQLYITSLYRAGMTYPAGRSWNTDVARDPRVRIKIGDKVYDRKLVFVSDPAEYEAAFQAKRKKYPKQVIPPGAKFMIFHAVES
ncbi:MAG: hypothetical protein EXQ47_00645 [Bryobacterales bacterium]|nr:hypothetical protein [Bryobacterales bacterium]